MGGLCDIAKDAPLRLNDVKRSGMALWAIGGHTIGQDDGMIATVIGSDGGGKTTDIGGDACDQEMADLMGLKDQFQLCAIKGIFARFVEKVFQRQGIYLVDDVVPLFPAYQNTSHRPH